MATLADFSPSLSAARPQGASRSLLARFQAWRAARREYAEAMHALSQIDDRDLRDLGISSFNFEAIARGEYQR